MVENCKKKLMDRVGIKKIHYFDSFIVFCLLHIYRFYCLYGDVLSMASSKQITLTL